VQEWGDASAGSSGSLVAQAYRLVERLAPFYAGVSGDQILVGCFGWLMDLVTEWTGDPEQPYPFVNRDARQWSGDNATYADVRDIISALKGETMHSLLLLLSFAPFFAKNDHFIKTGSGQT
jgi:hypothetical protein